MAVKEDFPFVRGVGAGNNLDQGGFARPVLSDQAVYFSGLHLKTDRIQGENPGKSLGHVI
jgi:hypothetical protein